MKIFSPTLKMQLKDCILSIFYPKKAIYSFFKDCSVPKQTLGHIEKWDEKELYRHSMIEILFDELGKQPDNGTLHFNLMLEALSEWNHFDKYWFETQNKLDLDEAKKKFLY